MHKTRSVRPRSSIDDSRLVYFRFERTDRLSCGWWVVGVGAEEKAGIKRVLGAMHHHPWHQ